MLFSSLEEAPKSDIEAAWDEEIRERLAASDRGEVEAIDAKTVFARAAEAELLHETDDYSKARKGFGVRFKDVVKTASDHAARTPEAGAPGFRGTRKFGVTGVPFNLHYRHSENEVPEDHELARLFRPPPAWANPQAPDLWRHLVQQLAAVLDARAILEGNPQATLERFRRQPGGMRHDDHVA